jgi:hypothetical protein
VVYLGKGIYRTSECGLDRLECKRADISALFFCELHMAQRGIQNASRLSRYSLYIYKPYGDSGRKCRAEKNIHLTIDKIHII